MAILPTRSFTTIVSSIAAGMQGRISIFLNFAAGSVLRAMAEAYAGVLLWLQGMVLAVAKLTRLATSYGVDADSWMTDWGLISRIGAVPATGIVTFSRFTPSGSAPVILAGATVETADGSVNYVVYADTTNFAYSVDAGGYVLPPQIASIDVPVQCTASGVPGNALAGQITQITSEIQGIDAVTNAAAFTNGSDQETDEALKARFRLAISSLSKGTESAIELAIKSLRTGLECTIRSSADIDGTVDYGMVSVVVDDGSGNLPPDVLAACRAAVNAVRAASIRVGVYAAVLNPVHIQLTVNSRPGYDNPTVRAQAAAAIAAGVNSLGLGQGLPYFTVGSWALAVPGVASIDSLIVNGGLGDIAGDPRKTIKTHDIILS